MSVPVSNDPGWTPVLRGKIFCSPRCGGSCTKAAYDAAVKHAAELAALLGPGWEPVVWENLGWHYECKKGVAEMQGYKGRSRDPERLVLFLRIPGDTIVVESDDGDARGLLRRGVRHARSVVRGIEDALALIETQS